MGLINFVNNVVSDTFDTTMDIVVDGLELIEDQIDNVEELIEDISDGDIL